VVGAVNRPITFQAEGGMTLLDAISRAQGLAPNAGPEILVASNSDRTQSLLRRIPVRNLIGSSSAEYNLNLVGGEEVRVPEAGKVFVIGNVKKPGLFPVQDVEGATVLQMLAYAEGLTPYASKTCFVYRKEGPTVRSKEIPFNIRDVLAHRAADIKLEANDILYVPDDSGRRVAIATLEKPHDPGRRSISGPDLQHRTLA